MTLVTLSYSSSYYYNWTFLLLLLRFIFPTSFHLFDNRFSDRTISALKIVSFFTKSGPLWQSNNKKWSTCAVDSTDFFTKSKKPWFIIDSNRSIVARHNCLPSKIKSLKSKARDFWAIIYWPDNVWMIEPLQLFQQRDFPQNGHGDSVFGEREPHGLQGHDVARHSVFGFEHRPVGTYWGVKNH